MTPVTAAAVTAAFAAAAALVWARRRLVRVTVDGPSMEPTFSSGSRLLVRRVRPDAVRRGAVVVLATPVVHGGATVSVPTGRWVVKRVAAVPGDPLPPVVAVSMGAPPGSRVPPGRLAVLGDNPRRSVDSRDYGLVPLDGVLGVAVGNGRW